MAEEATDTPEPEPEEDTPEPEAEEDSPDEAGEDTPTYEAEYGRAVQLLKHVMDSSDDEFDIDDYFTASGKIIESALPGKSDRSSTGKAKAPKKSRMVPRATATAAKPVTPTDYAKMSKEERHAFLTT